MDADGAPAGDAPRPAGPAPGAARRRVAVLGAGLVALGLVAGDHGPRPAGPPPPAPAASSPAVVPVAAGADLRATEVRLPAVDVRSPLVDLDVGPDGALQVPADPAVAGWFVRGAAPGEPGPTVIAGHVDSRSGPGVFFRLDELVAGDRVEVARSDGRVVAYRVVTVETHAKDAFPTTRVYGPAPGPGRRRLTGGGGVDRRSRHYRDNVVVTAIPVT